MNQCYCNRTVFKYGWLVRGSGESQQWYAKNSHFQIGPTEAYLSSKCQKGGQIIDNVTSQLCDNSHSGEFLSTANRASQTRQPMYSVLVNV